MKKTTFQPRDYGLLLHAIPKLHGPMCGCSLCTEGLDDEEKARREKLRANHAKKVEEYFRNKGQ